MTIDIPSNFVVNVASSSTSMLSSLGGVSTLIIGITLAFIILNLAISVFSKDEKGIE